MAQIYITFRNYLNITVVKLKYPSFTLSMIFPVVEVNQTHKKTTQKNEW